MAIPSTCTIVDQLQHAGLKLSLAPAGGLAVGPSSRLTTDLRDLIRSSKAQLIDWLTAANDTTSPLPDPPENAWNWKELAAAYQAHHFNCPACIAAGRGTQYGQRCETGIALWSVYQDSALSTSIDQ